MARSLSAESNPDRTRVPLSLAGFNGRVFGNRRLGFPCAVIFGAVFALAGPLHLHLQHEVNAAPPSNSPTTQSVRPEIAALIAKGRSAAGLVYFELDRSAAYAAVARVQFATGDADGARGSLAEARYWVDVDQFPESQSRAYCEIAAVSAQGGDTAGVKLAFTAALKAAARVKDNRERAFRYADIAVAQSRTGDAAGASPNFAAALKASTGDGGAWRGWTDPDIISRMAESGDVAGAKAAAANIDQDTLKPRAWLLIVKAQAKVSDLTGARKTAENISESFSKESAFAAIATAQARAGDVKGAKATIRDLRPYALSGAMVAIAAAQAKAGDYAAAESTIANFAPDWQAEGFAAMAEAESAVPARAKSSAAKARDAAALIINLAARASTYRKIALAQIHAGDRAGAWASLADARSAAARLDAQNNNEVVYKMNGMPPIGIAQVDAGDLDGARATAAMMDFYERGQAEVCRAIAAAEARNGNVDAGEGWAQTLTAPVTRAFAYVGLAEGLFAREATDPRNEGADAKK